MVGGVNTTKAYLLADILGIDLCLDRQGDVTGKGSFVAELGDLRVDFPLEVVSGSGNPHGAFAVARCRGNLIIIVGGDGGGSRCAFVDAALCTHWRSWAQTTKARSFDAAVRELGKSVVASFRRDPLRPWARVG